MGATLYCCIASSCGRNVYHYQDSRQPASEEPRFPKPDELHCLLQFLSLSLREFCYADFANPWEQVERNVYPAARTGSKLKEMFIQLQGQQHRDLSAH